jgi:hypothetical protein
MILFHAKMDGTVTTTPDLVPQGSSMQDLVVVSEFDYAYCAIKLLPASGEYIEDTPCTPILQSDFSTIFVAPLNPKATVVAGSVDYQLIFTAADGTTQTTLAGSFTVPRGVPVSTPGSVEELSVKTINDLYTIMSNTYGLFVGHEGNIYKNTEDIAAHEGNIARNTNDIAALKEKITTAGTVTIPMSEWTDAAPTVASVAVSGVDTGSIILMLPADEKTRLTANNAKLSAYPAAFAIIGGDGSVTILRAEAETVPDSDMTFAYIVLKTGFSFTNPIAAIIGVDAYGEGGGTASGVDETAVKKIINSMLGKVENVLQYSADNPPPYPVTSVNGKTGAVMLAIPSEAADVRADPVGTAESKTAALRQEVNGKLADYDKSAAVNNKISSHNTSTESHEDLRLELKRLADRLNAALNSDDTSLDDLKEIVAYIKSNKTLIDGITSSKVNVTDIVNNLTTNSANVPLSAAQGVVLKLLIDSLEDVVDGKVTADQVAAQIKAALTDYLTKEEAAELYQPKEKGKGLSANDYTDADKAAVVKAASDSAAAKQTADSANETALAVRAAKDRGELDGEDGKSPTVTVKKVGSAATITATNPDGTTYTEQVQDGIIQAEVLYVDTVSDLAGETIDKSKVYVCIEDNKQYGFKAVEVVKDSGDLMQTAVMGSGTYGWTNTTVTDTGYDGEPILDEDGNPKQVTVGYNKGRRLSGDGSSKDMATVNHSGFIEVADDDVVTIRNMVGVAATSLYAIVYDENFTKIGSDKRINATNPDGPPIALDGVWSLNADGSITTVDKLSKVFGATGIKYIRFSFGLATLPSLHVKPTVELEAKWAAIRDWPADRSEDISKLSEEVNKHDVRLHRLEQGMAGKPQTQDAAIQLMRTWDKPINDTAPVVLIEGDTKPAVGSRTTLTAIYSAYDKLVTDYPLYVTKTPLGKDAGGTLDIHRYDICAPTPHENSDGDHPAITRPKIILISGIHTEWVGIWSLYHAIEEILTNPAFADIKRNVHLIVVPACNPYCLDEATRGNSSGRTNANGVEIHRNFTVGWADNPNPEGNEHWGGVKELSEAESRYIDAIMAENPDAVAFVSCHNFDQGGGSDYGTTFMWASTATAYLHNLGGRFGVKMSDAWEAKYGDTWRANINANKTAKQPAGDYTVGMAGVSKTEGGTEARQGMLYGIQGMTFEVGGDMVALNTNGADAVCVTRGAEVYANLIKTLLADYDHHDKAEYAPIMPADLS